MAQIKILRDGTVEAMIGTQDIGSGSRTVVAILTSRAFGYLPLEKVNVKIGDSDLPASGASAGSSTTGGVTREIQDAARRVQTKLFELAAEKLGAKPEDLEIKEGGVVGPRGKGGGLKWEEAAGLIKDSIIGHASSVVEPGYQWAVVREDGVIDQADEQNYKA
jgi:xanthine dehydrogenase YagR molybdenum-binding subunit